MRKKPITKIDHDLCTGCGLCVKICPSDTLEVLDDKAVVSSDESMRCAQCVAVCPEGAIRLDGIGTPGPTLIGQEPGSRELVDLMMSRRSCRSYKSKAVSKQLIADLVTLGTWAPSGTNSQSWHFTVIPDRQSMLLYAQKVANFFHKTNRMAESGFNRLMAKFFMGDALGKYYRDHYESVKQALDEWETNQIDKLFHGATAAILISTTPDASCPVEDAMMAAQNIVLAAEAAGLGTCLIGYAVEAMARDRGIGELLGISSEETVHAVIALGHPAVKYQRPSGRMLVTPRYFVGDQGVALTEK